MEKSLKTTPAKCVEQLAISQPPEKTFNFNAIFKPQNPQLQPNASQERSSNSTSTKPMLAQSKLAVSTSSHQSFPNIASWAKKSIGAENSPKPEDTAFVHAILVFNITSDVMTTVSDRAQRLECYTIDVGPDVDKTSRIFRFFDARQAAKFQGSLVKNPWFKNLQTQPHYDAHLNVMVFSVSTNLWPQIESDLLQTLEAFGEVCLLQSDPTNMMYLPDSIVVGNQETIVCKFWDMRDMHKVQSLGSIGLKSGLILTPVCVSVNPLSLNKFSQIRTPLTTPLSAVQASIPPPTPQLNPQLMPHSTPISFSLNQTDCLARPFEYQVPYSTFQSLNAHQSVSGLAFNSVGQSFVTKESAHGGSKVAKSYPFSDINGTLFSRQNNVAVSAESRPNLYTRKALKAFGTTISEEPSIVPLSLDSTNLIHKQISKSGSGFMWEEPVTRQTDCAEGNQSVLSTSEYFEQQQNFSSKTNLSNVNSNTVSSHFGHRYGTIDSVSSISSMSSTESQTTSEFADECAALFKRFGITKPTSWLASPPPSPPLKQATPTASRRARRAQQAPPSVSKYDSNGSPDQLETNIDLKAIEDGTEKRCTVMVRNIPNKLEFEEFKAFMDATSQNCYDFLYLRFDFTNRCNVGYAFVSFTHPNYVKEFVEKRSGMNWKELNHNSGKIVDLRYAKIQGHFNLVQKFRNSPVMAQEQSFRPRFYHTSGPLKGQEIEFDSTSHPIH